MVADGGHIAIDPLGFLDINTKRVMLFGCGQSCNRSRHTNAPLICL